jgi:hypothetical protein
LSRLKTFDGLKSFMPQPEPPTNTEAATMKDNTVDDLLKLFMFWPFKFGQSKAFFEQEETEGTE